MKLPYNNYSIKYHYKMKQLQSKLAIFIFLVIIGNVLGQEKKLTNKERLEWFQGAKLGVFIHWGYYGVEGIGESWSMYHKKISY